VLARIDAMLGAFIARLEAHMRLAILITSDHGVVPLVERSLEHGHEGAVRYTSEAEIAALRAELGPSAEAWVQPWVYVGGDDRDAAIRRAIAFIEARPGIAAAIDARRGASLREESDALARAYGASMPESWPGAILVMPREWSVANEELPEGHGTSHGSPWSYDREVPAIYAGRNVAYGASTEILAQARVASTIAALLGVDPPEHAEREPLPGVHGMDAAPSR
jgi:arylsulfatase A-like enzyme